VCKRKEGLTPRQHETLLQAIERGDDDVIGALLAELTADGICCPHCGAIGVVRWGQTRGLQRWRCKECRRTFTALTGTGLGHLRLRDRWTDYAESIRRGEPLKQAAERCGIHINTAFRWRHRFLQGGAHSLERLTGITEADETFVRRSAKGQPELRKQWARPPRRRGGTVKKPGRNKEHVIVWVARDRGGATVDKVLDHVDTATLRPLLAQAVSPDAILCTDGWRAYYELPGNWTFGMNGSPYIVASESASRSTSRTSTTITGAGKPGFAGSMAFQPGTCSITSAGTGPSRRTGILAALNSYCEPR
jgi:transposase-like protein/IS1 family transposase